jgi:hypothetical protein
VCDFESLTDVLAEGELILGEVALIDPLAKRLKIEVDASALAHEIVLGHELPLAEDVIPIRDHVNSVIHKLESRVLAYLRHVPRNTHIFVTESVFQANMRLISSAFADVNEWQATIARAMGSEPVAEIYAYKADGIRRHLDAHPAGCVKKKKKKIDELGERGDTLAWRFFND